jgi:hypothetical protein
LPNKNFLQFSSPKTATDYDIMLVLNLLAWNEMRHMNMKNYVVWLILIFSRNSFG